MGIKISCDEATKICNKTQYHEANFWERIKLSIHFVYCSVCRLYTKQNKQITKWCQELKQHKEAEHQISEAKKNELKNKLNKLQKEIE